LNEITMCGQGAVSEGPTPNGLWWHNANLKSWPHDPARAKALLTESGYASGFE
jgi:ABC-type transport system substrate-binding protein